MASPSRDRPGSPITLRDEQRDVTRRRLLTAATAVFARTGYGQAKIGDITAEASINRATFYLHFSNKADVLQALVDQVVVVIAGYWRLLDDALTKNSRPAIREWLEIAVEWWDGNAAVQSAWQEAAAADVRIAAQWAVVFDQLSLELGGYLGRLPENEREDALTRIHFLVVQLDQICFRWRIQGVFTLDHQRLIDVLTDIWCSVLRIDAP